MRTSTGIVLLALVASLVAVAEDARADGIDVLAAGEVITLGDGSTHTASEGRIEGYTMGNVPVTGNGTYSQSGLRYAGATPVGSVGHSLVVGDSGLSYSATATAYYNFNAQASVRIDFIVTEETDYTITWSHTLAAFGSPTPRYPSQGEYLVQLYRYPVAGSTNYQAGNLGILEGVSAAGAAVDQTDFPSDRLSGTFTPGYWYRFIAVAEADYYSTATIEVDIAFSSSAAVPEPGTLALLGLGLFGVALHRRRRMA